LYSVSPTRIRALTRHITTTSHERPTSSAPRQYRPLNCSHGPYSSKNRNPPRDKTHLLQRSEYDLAYE
jgi:hypothetical protein